jgi:GTP cyclohydrolase I
MSDSFVDNVSRIVCAIDARPEVGERVCKAIADRLIHLLGGDECNFSWVESYMDATGEKSNPAETSDASTDHVSFDTRLKLKTYACIILEFADTLGIDYPNGSKITDVAAEIRKRLSVLMSECKVMGFAKSAEIAKPESEDGGEVTITDELRKWIKSLYTPNSDKLKLEGLRIVDRIDEQFDRICTQQETVLQQTIDEMVTELDSARAKNRRLSKKWREKCEALKAENAELQEKNRHLAQKCDAMLVLSNRAMNTTNDQEQRIEKLVRQRDELRVKLKEIGEIANG